MKSVGVRELKDRLSEHLRTVRAGEGILVTDRGEVIAALTPPDAGTSDPGIPPGLAALARRGVLTPASRRQPYSYPPLKPLRLRRRSIEMLDESRGPR